MGKREGYSIKREPVLSSDDKFVRMFIRDIRINGMGYVKSETAAKAIREAAPDLIIHYSKQERLYTITIPVED